MSTPEQDGPAWIIQAADGFLDMKMTARAQEKLDQVPPGQRSRPDFKRVHLRLLMEQGLWGKAAETAKELLDLEPTEAIHWIQLAYSVRRAQDLSAAKRILESARQRFPDEAIIPYNLSCYACQSGELDEARQLLRAAEQLGPYCRALAREDTDLQPLWDELEEE